MALTSTIGAPALMGAQAGGMELWCSKFPQGEGIGSGKDSGVHVCSREMM